MRKLIVYDTQSDVNTALDQCIGTHLSSQTDYRYNKVTKTVETDKYIEQFIDKGSLKNLIGRRFDKVSIFCLDISKDNLISILNKLESN